MQRLPAAFPPSKMRVAPLGVNVDDLTVTTRTRRRSVHDRLSSRASRPRRACTISPTPIASCAPEGPAAVAAARRRLPGAGAQAVPRGHRRATCARAGLGDEFVYRGTRRSRAEGAVLPRHRRAVGAERLSRAEGPVPARGDGVRRAGGAAEPRRVSGDDRAHRRRRAGAVGIGRRHRRCAVRTCGRDPARAARARPQRRRGRARALHRATHGGRVLAATTAFHEARGATLSCDARSRRSRRPIPRRPATRACCATCRSRSTPASGVRDGTVGLRQEHAALHPRRARAADQRHGAARRQRSLRAVARRRWRRFAIAKSASCSRITACCRSAPCSRTCWCRRWSARRDPGRAGRARARSWRRSASPSGCTIGRRSCRAARSSAPPSPAR